MRKALLFAVAASFIFAAGCKKSETNAAAQDKTQNAPAQEENALSPEQQELNKLRSLAANLAQEFYTNGTKEALDEAINISENILKISDDKRDVMFRVQLLYAAGRKGEAFKLQANVLPEDQNDPSVIMYKALEAKIKKDTKESAKLFAQAIAEIDKRIDKVVKENPNDPSIASMKMSKVDAYVMSGNKTKAKEVVEEIYKLVPVDQNFKNFRDNFDSIAKEASKFYDDIEL